MCNIGRNNWRQVFLDGNHVLNLTLRATTTLESPAGLPHEPYTPFWIRHLKLLDLKFEGIEKARNFVTSSQGSHRPRREPH